MIWHKLTDKENDILASTDKIPVSSEKTTLCVIKEKSSNCRKVNYQNE